MDTFYLGTHMPHWLSTAGFPLFVSHRRLQGRKTLPRAATRWALDSGGFTELSMHGKWTVSPQEYVDAVYRYRDEIGQLDWAAPQDWMCEPWIIAKTGLSVAKHQALTIENYLTLRRLAPDLPFIPVVQGYTLADYQSCVAVYHLAGIDLSSLPTVGVGSVCRRQHTKEIGEITRALKDSGLRLHGFGVKTRGLADYEENLVSADSMAWSFRGRHVPGCTSSHVAENNCLQFARQWRAKLLEAK